MKFNKHNKNSKKRLAMWAIFGLVILIVALVGYALFVLFSVNRFASYWEAESKLPRNETSRYVVALGDSTVQGIGATSPRKGFVGRLVEKLQKDTGKDIQLYNFSKSGATSADVLNDQLENVDKIGEANLIIIAVGPNDLIKGVSLDDYMANYQKIIEGLPASRVVIANIPPLDRKGVGNTTVEEWNVQLDAFVARNHLTAASIYQVIYPRRNDPRIYSGDFFHPSNGGYRLWAGAFYEPAKAVLDVQD